MEQFMFTFCRRCAALFLPPIPLFQRLQRPLSCLWHSSSYMLSEVSLLGTALYVMCLQKSGAFGRLVRTEHRHPHPPLPTIFVVLLRLVVPLKRLWLHVYRKARSCSDWEVLPSLIEQSWYGTWLYFSCCAPSKTLLCAVSPTYIRGRYHPVCRFEQYVQTREGATY